MISIDGDEYAYIITTDSTGAFSITLTAPSSNGSYSISAYYTGDSSYTSATSSASLTVNPLSTSVTVSDVTEKYGNTIVLTANVVDENGNAVTTGKISFKLNGRTIGSADVINGLATYNYTITNPCSYTITARYGENGVYTASESMLH